MHGVNYDLRGRFQGRGGLRTSSQHGGKSARTEVAVATIDAFDTGANRPSKQPRQFVKLTHAAPLDSLRTCCQAYFDNL